jgi:hypothetical protein
MSFSLLLYLLLMKCSVTVLYSYFLNVMYYSLTCPTLCFPGSMRHTACYWTINWASLMPSISSHTFFFKIHFNIIHSYILHLLNGFFHSDFLTKILCVFLMAHVCCMFHSSHPPWFNHLIIFGNEYKLWRFSLCSFLSLSSCYFMSLRSRYSPLLCILKHTNTCMMV